MFSITFFLATGLGPIILLFKGEDTARNVINLFETMGPMGGMWIKDDFGQECFVRKDVLGVLLQDMKQAQEADIIRGVHQATTQAKAQERAKEDPFLQRHFRSMQQGPAVFSPMGAGMNGPRFNG